ncbi:acyl-CoA thioesterase [Acinetobacter towneri]|uniref:Acyl-CoA thioesterase n=2 Tax=Acinetobacter TaxID=469 RepID=A0AAP9KIY2_9GAMM|nr:thioesterase [Acinetobacter pseudolwoffii]QGM27302.1 acyl-CoA thioesterase [Acinetobacter towneri]
MVAYIVNNQVKFSQVTRPISWGEMDLFGHLNNVHYFRYMEDARIDFLDQFQFFKESLYSVILKNECEYKAPVLYPDQLVTRSYVTHVGNTSFSMCYEIYSEAQQKVIAVGNSVIVIVDQKNFSKQPIPIQIKESIQAYMIQFPYGGLNEQAE